MDPVLSATLAQFSPAGATPALIIRFVNSSGFVSAAIDFVEGGAGEFDHTECLDLNTLEWVGAHASGGFQRRPFDYMKPSKQRIYAIPCTQEEYLRGAAWLDAHIGTAYDFSDIVGILIHGNQFDPKKLICSWAMFTYIFSATNRLPLNARPENAHRITPEILHLAPVFIDHAIEVDLSADRPTDSSTATVAPAAATTTHILS